ncbi:MAG: hypothetical protein CVU00_13095 [Bacteroidetes bacterium HGW-Bacteroidetes-17]|jgi:hypothetical protein|nr:MAG: hypothetical protein CVU00_13095 [Bacteroidetes bacterium HGW-Bacteroidetes-17]
MNQNEKPTTLMLFYLLLFCSLAMLNGTMIPDEIYSIKSASSPDTLYSGQIITRAHIQGFPLQNAEIKFNLLDSINQTSKLIHEGFTNHNGELLIDSLPIVNNYVGIDAFLIDQNAKSQVYISNNGTGSDHGIVIHTKLDISKQGNIIDMNGKLIEKIKFIFNPLNNSVEGYWKGASVKTGIYICYVETLSGIISGKISHVSNHLGTNSNKGQAFSSTQNLANNQLKEAATDHSKYKLEIYSAVAEPFEQAIYIYEHTNHEFNFSLEHLPIPYARIEGYVSTNRVNRIGGANILFTNLTSNLSFELTTDSIGNFYKVDVSVPLDGDFTMPETTRYYVTVNIGDSIIFKVDPVTVISGELTTEVFNINIL